MTGSKRYSWFIVSIILGISLGLYYGWMVNPREVRETPPSNLRSDYQADYVLMVAEIFNADGDLTLASYRLARLEKETPLTAVNIAIATAAALNYDEKDLALMRSLAEKLSALEPPASEGSDET